jgi:hypothetical protein
MILRVHLIPFLGSKKLDAITNEDVQRLKGRLVKKAAKTVNNILTVLNVVLKKAVECEAPALSLRRAECKPNPRRSEDCCF